MSGAVLQLLQEYLNLATFSSVYMDKNPFIDFRVIASHSLYVGEPSHLYHAPTPPKKKKENTQ